LFLLARIRKWPIPRGREAAGPAIYGLLGFGVSYALLYFALVELSPGLTSVVMAAVPLVTLALAVAHGQERFTTRAVIGGMLAVAGIGLLFARTITADIELVYFLAAVLGVVSIAESTVVVKSFPRAHPFTTNAVGMTVGALFLWIASVVFREEWIVPRRGQTWIVLGWLVIAGSIGLFALFLFVIGRWTASATVYAVAMMPLVAVTLGVLFADEELSLELIAGAVLVLAAIYVGALARAKPALTPQPPEAAAPLPESAPGG
jgi:drug/metabolite transporter (DMT)-like permease